MRRTHETGVVEWFADQSDKQFGKIRSREGLIFFHRALRCCAAVSKRIPIAGDKVTFASEMDRRGPKAKWWAFSDEFDPSQVPVDEKAQRAKEATRRMAELMVKKLKQFGFSDLTVTACGYIKSWQSYGHWATSNPTTLVTLLTDPDSAFNLMPFETVGYEGVSDVCQDGEKIGKIHKMRFLYHEAPNVEAYLAFAFATDLEMWELPDEAVTNAAKLVRKLLDRLTADSDKTEAQKCFKNRFCPQLRTLIKFHQRTGRIQYKHRIFMWSYEEADVHLRSLWNVATREKFGQIMSI